MFKMFLGYLTFWKMRHDWRKESRCNVMNVLRSALVHIFHVVVLFFFLTRCSSKHLHYWERETWTDDAEWIRDNRVRRLDCCWHEISGRKGKQDSGTIVCGETRPRGKRGWERLSGKLKGQREKVRKRVAEEKDERRLIFLSQRWSYLKRGRERKTLQLVHKEPEEEG